MTVLHIETVHVDDCGGRWLRPKQLQAKFSITRTTVWKLLSEMRAIPKYKGDFIDYSKTLRLVRERAFLEYFKSQDKAYLKRANPSQSVFRK